MRNLFNILFESIDVEFCVGLVESGGEGEVYLKSPNIVPCIPTDLKNYNNDTVSSRSSIPDWLFRNKLKVLQSFLHQSWVILTHVKKYLKKIKLLGGNIFWWSINISGKLATHLQGPFSEGTDGSIWWWYWVIICLEM